MTCPATTYIVPPHPVIGERWSSTCHQSGSGVRVDGVVIGPSHVTVGTQSVPAIHTRFTMHFSGSEQGVSPTDVWMSPEGGLILRQHETVSVAEGSTPLGSVHYSETMDITLRSLVPKR